MNLSYVLVTKMTPAVLVDSAFRLKKPITDCAEVPIAVAPYNANAIRAYSAHLPVKDALFLEKHFVD